MSQWLNIKLPILLCLPLFLRSVCVLTFHIFDISSETTGPILTKLVMYDPQRKSFHSCTNQGAHKDAKTGKIRANFKNILLRMTKSLTVQIFGHTSGHALSKLYNKKDLLKNRFCIVVSKVHIVMHCWKIQGKLIYSKSKEKNCQNCDQTSYACPYNKGIYNCTN